jgi:hypothetical protein
MIGLMLAAAVASAGSDPRCSGRIGPHQLPRGVISSPSIAKQVAEIYLTSIYGADVIREEKPLVVSMRAGVWRVTGSLKAGWKGGVAQIDLCQTTGQVLSFDHEK